jgi:hypothetical protein
VQHIGFPTEIAETIVQDRVPGARLRRLPRGDVGRVEARLVADRQGREYERRLSGLGAAALLVLVLLGPVAVAVLALTAALAVAIEAAVADRFGRAFPASEDRWQVWRRVDPDPEYLRGRA